jgi:ubiquinone/menaquinone biosynthesis C-methylase UbiE
MRSRQVIRGSSPALASSRHSGAERTALALFLLLAQGCLTTRATATEADRIAEVIGLRPGMVIADVGAGDGEWSEELARRVGEEGHVFATEVEREKIEEIRERAETGGLENLTVVLGDQNESGLPENCCDAILLRMVYHHFEQPKAMRSSLRRSLRPKGILAVIDINPQKSWRELPEVPDRGGHGIEPVELIREMTAEGFRVAARYEDWNGDEDRYCVVFDRPGNIED